MTIATNRARCILLTLATSALLGPMQTTFAQTRTRDGATAGGLAGAIIGGIIGKQNDEIPEGALIGGAVGAITGGLIGKAQDQDLARQRYYQQQAYYNQQQQLYTQQQAITQSGISINDVINMSRSGLSESVILTQLQSKGVQKRLEVSEIIALHQQGVSDTLITAVQNAPLATQVAGRVAAPAPAVPQSPIYGAQPSYPSSVIIQEPVIYSRPPIVVERVYRPAPRYHHHYYHGPHHGSSASIRIGF